MFGIGKKISKQNAKITVAKFCPNGRNKFRAKVFATMMSAIPRTTGIWIPPNSPLNIEKENKQIFM